MALEDSNKWVKDEYGGRLMLMSEKFWAMKTPMLKV